MTEEVLHGKLRELRHDFYKEGNEIEGEVSEKNFKKGKEVHRINNMINNRLVEVQILNEELHKKKLGKLV